MTTKIEEDPIVKKTIGKINLFMRESHKLPLYYSTYPFYDRALPRICKKINKIDKKLVLIDVGANIGDTVSLIANETHGSFLCIEGDNEYLDLLKMNAVNIKNSQIFIEESYCSESHIKNNNFKIERFNGTSKLTIAGEEEIQKNASFKNLDNIISQHTAFQNANVLKIDTDGFEINVLKGGENFLNNALPIIYFEFVPELYLNNNQNPMFIPNFLRKKGYHSALFYDNFGVPIEIVDMADEKRIKELVSLIDNDKIYYYDILTWHHSKHKKYEKIFNNELKINKNEV